MSIQNFGRSREKEKNGVDLGSFYELDEVTNASPSSSSSFSLVFKLKKEKQDNDLAKVILSGDCVLSLYYRYHHHNENVDENDENQNKGEGRRERGRDNNNKGTEIHDEEHNFVFLCFHQLLVKNEYIDVS